MSNIHQYMGMSNRGLFEVIGGYVDNFESIAGYEQEDDEDIYVKGKQFFYANVKTIQSDICNKSAINYFSQDDGVNLISQVADRISESVGLTPAAAIAVLVARMELTKFCSLSADSWYRVGLLAVDRLLTAEKIQNDSFINYEIVIFLLLINMMSFIR